MENERYLRNLLGVKRNGNYERNPRTPIHHQRNHNSNGFKQNPQNIWKYGQLTKQDVNELEEGKKGKSFKVALRGMFGIYQEPLSSVKKIKARIPKAKEWLLMLERGYRIKDIAKLTRSRTNTIIEFRNICIEHGILEQSPNKVSKLKKEITELKSKNYKQQKEIWELKWWEKECNKCQNVLIKQSNDIREFIALCGYNPDTTLEELLKKIKNKTQ